MDPIRRKLILSIVFGLLAAGLAWMYLYHQEQELLHRASEQKVLVAARYIPAYTRIDESYLAWRNVPAEYLPKGAINDPGEIRGLLTLAPFNPNETIVFNKLARSSQSLAAAVPEGKRAFSIAVDAVSGVSGLIRPGDYVDVLLLTDSDEGGKGKGQSMAATLFQAVQVVAAGNTYSVEDKNNTADQSNTVTLALTPQECEVMLFAQSHGRIQLSLRPPDDKSMVEIKSANFSTVLSHIGQVSTAQEKGKVVEIIRGQEKQDFEIKKR